MRTLSLIAAMLVGGGMALAQTSAPLSQAGPAVTPQETAKAATIQWTPQTPTPAANTPQLPEPVSVPTKADGTRYLNRPELLKFCTAQVAEFNDHDADMIFVGDSITQNWVTVGADAWQKYFVPRHALDFGISGDQTQNVLWRLENYPVQRLHPKVAVVLIGTNNLHNTAPEIASGVQAVVAKVQAMWPGIKVILVSIMPNARANDLMMAADGIIKGLADGKNIYYLDLVAAMTPVDDNWKGLGKGKLHPDASGYALWSETMLPLLNTLLPAPVGAEATTAK